MATETLKSVPITNLDLTPPQVMGPATGGPQVMRTTDGYVTPTNGATVGSVYKFCRLPSNARLKEVSGKFDPTVSAATFTVSVGFYYSDSLNDYTTPANQGTAVNGTTGSGAITTSIALATVTTKTDLMATDIAVNFDKELWEVCGLTTDPHCPFDLSFTSLTTANAITTGAPFYVRATYTVG
jgi:hypothetical protein